MKNGEHTFSRAAEVDNFRVADDPIPIFIPISGGQDLFERLGGLRGMPIPQRVRRKAIKASLSSDERFSPNSWPFTARLFVPGGPMNPVGI